MYFVLISLVLLALAATLLIQRIQESRRNSELLKALGISAATGDAFFRSLVLHLSRVLQTDYASVAELSADGSRLRTVAVVADGQITEPLEYDVPNTPCERALAETRCVISDDVQSVFPLDRITPSLGLKSYLGVALVDSAGKPLGVLSVMSRRQLKTAESAAALLDVFAQRASAEMERHRSERALQQSESRNRAILKAFPDLMFVQDQEGTLLEYYAADRADLYQPPNHFLGKKIQDVLPVGVSAAILRGVKQLVTSHETVSVEYQLPIQGEQRFYEARMVDLEPNKILTIVRNVTARRQAEHELEQSKHFAQRIAETMPSVMFLYDLVEKRNVYVNERSAAVLGYTPGEVIEMGDQFVPRTMHPDDVSRLQGMAKQYVKAQDGEVMEHLFRFRHKNGSWRWIQRSATVFARNTDGQPIQILGTGTDITALKMAERQLQSLSARLLGIQDEERRRIARELHDGVAQVLFGIGASLTTLRKRDDLPDYAVDVLSECGSQCDEGLREVRLMSYLLHPPLLDEVGLVPALKWFAEGFARRSGLDVNVEAADTDRRLPLELERDLFRIVQEGLANVARHSGSTRAVVRLDQSANQVVLEIQDFGHGMPLKSNGDLEETHAVGVGILGMRERLRHVGGELSIDSGAGGTTLTTTVPLHLEEVST